MDLHNDEAHVVVADTEVTAKINKAILSIAKDEISKLREQNRSLVAALELMLERIAEPPEANCSCHISPPCNDCVDYSGEREAFECAKDALASLPEPVAAQGSAPVGYDPEEIDNVFSTLRYVIGLNPGKKAPTAHCKDIIEMVASWSDMGKFHPMYSQFRAAAADRAMLAAAPEAPHDGLEV